MFDASMVVCTNARITANQCSTTCADYTTVDVPCLTFLWTLLVFRTQYVASAANNTGRYTLLMIRHRTPKASDKVASFVWHVIT